MQVLTTGKNIDIGDSLRAHITERLERDVAKYFDGAVRAHVTVEKQRSSFSTDCTLHLSTGLTLQAHGEGGDAYSGFDTAAAHLEKRLRRYKRRLKDHHQNNSGPMPSVPAASFVIESSPENDDESSASLNPAIIAEASHDITQMAIGDAVMQLELSSEDFVLFRSTKHGGLNVVYKRKDGNIGWIDPGTEAK
jgi:ribosomal subunit interface protein